MKVVDKKEIIDYYYNSHKASYYLFVENWLRCSSVLRNIVAHRGRLYNRSFTIQPRLDKKDKSLLLVNSSGNVILDKLFSQVLALQNLCPKKNMWLDFCYDLFVLTETVLPSEVTVISPFRSVRYTFTSASRRRLRTVSVGWP